MTITKEQNIDVVSILSSAIAISGPPSPVSTKIKTVPHKAGKTTPSTSGAKKRSWKKPADKPKRPLSAYNLFFKAERARLISGGTPSSSPTDDPNGADANKRKHRKSHGKIGFAALAQNIAGKWKTLSAKDRRPFEEKAAVEKARYRKELEVWQRVQKEKKLNEPITSNDGAANNKATDNLSNAVPDSPASSSDGVQADNEMKTSNASDNSTKRKKISKKKKAIAAKEPLSLPSSMPFYPMNLKGSPTTANIAPITLQSMGMPSYLAAPVATTARSMMPPMSLDVSISHGLLQDADATNPNAAAVTPSGSCGNSVVEYDDDAERDILSDVADSSMLDESFGFLPALPVFPTFDTTTGTNGIVATAEEEKILMQADPYPSMDKLMSEAF